MDNISLKHVITALAEQFMIGSAKTVIEGDTPFTWRSLSKGLAAIKFNIQLSFDNYGYEKDGSTHHTEWERSYYRNLHVLVTSNHNVFVYAADSQQRIFDPELYDNSSNHDSCWRSDGLNIIDKIFNEGYEHCWSHVPKAHRRTPAEAHSFVRLDWAWATEPAFSYVWVTGVYDSDNRRQRWKLTEVSPMDFEVYLRPAWHKPKIEVEPETENSTPEVKRD